jgi:hypothetical protein
VSPAHLFSVSLDWARYAETWRGHDRRKALLGLRRHIQFREQARTLAKQAKAVKP